MSARDRRILGEIEQIFKRDDPDLEARLASFSWPRPLLRARTMMAGGAVAATFLVALIGMGDTATSCQPISTTPDRYSAGQGARGSSDQLAPGFGAAAGERKQSSDCS